MGAATMIDTTLQRMYELGQPMRAARGVAARQGFTAEEILEGLLCVAAAEATLQGIPDVDLRARLDHAIALAQATRLAWVN